MPAALTSLPVATTVGNHDADNANYQYHFNVPNLSTLGDNGTVGGDYYFTYGDVLFIMLNTQDTNSAEHIQFIQETVEANPDCTWKIVTLHQDIYGSAEHSNEPEIVNLRYALTPAFETCGIDVVLTGHDHAYSRSYFLNGDGEETDVLTYTDDDFDDMLDVDIDNGDSDETLTIAPGNISDDTADEDERAYLEYLYSIMDEDRITEDTDYVVDPEGIMYLTASSSSGSKYYDLVARQQSYIVARWQEDVPTYSLIEVDGNTLTVNTYRTDTNETIDNTVTIVKTTTDDGSDDDSDDSSEAGNNGLVNVDGTWGYYVDGVLQSDYTGFQTNEKGTWYIEKGYITFLTNGIIQNPEEKDSWYYVIGSKVQTDYTGVSDFGNSSGWWYIKNGKVDFSANTVASNKYGWWYVVGGKVQFNYTGVANYSNSSGWWYIKNGKVDFSYTGKASNKYGTWKVVNGKVNF